MPDILSFRDDLLAHLIARDEATPNAPIDITDFIKSYGLNHMHSMSVAINNLFAPKDKSPQLITSEQDLGEYGFTQSYFNRNIYAPVKVRITPEGRKLSEKPQPKKDEIPTINFYPSKNKKGIWDKLETSQKVIGIIMAIVVLLMGLKSCHGCKTPPPKTPLTKNTILESNQILKKASTLSTS